MVVSGGSGPNSSGEFGVDDPESAAGNVVYDPRNGEHVGVPSGLMNGLES